MAVDYKTCTGSTRLIAKVLVGGGMSGLLGHPHTCPPPPLPLPASPPHLPPHHTHPPSPPHPDISEKKERVLVCSLKRYIGVCVILSIFDQKLKFFNRPLPFKVHAPSLYAWTQTRGVVISEMKVPWLHTQRKDDGQHYFVEGFRF